MVRRMSRVALAILLPTVFPAVLAAQDAQVLASLRGETGVDPAPGTLLATVSRFSTDQALLVDALVQLAERSQVQIAFSPSLLPGNLRVNCDCATLSLARALDHLLADTDLGYVELGSQVVVVPKAGYRIPDPDGVLRGRVRSEVAIPLEDATARLRAPGHIAEELTTGTDRLGYFAFHGLAPGDYFLTVERIGYVPHEAQVTVAAGDDLHMAVTLAEQAIALEGVRVEGERSRQRARFEDLAGATIQEIGRTALKTIPGVAEADPLRTVEVLPGVTRVSDIAAAFNVRGGSADQNLILLDGVELFNPFHTMGLFSVFNADMVGRTELQSGGFAAEYGGRVSSLLRIESDLGDGEWGVDGAVSLLASRAAVKGGLSDVARGRLGLANARWKVSGRRSYLDVLTDPFLRIAFPYQLRDLQAAFEGWTDGGDRLHITSYVGRDILNASEAALFGDQESDPTPEADALWLWGNEAVGASWTRPMPDGQVLEVRGSASRSHGNFEFSEFGDVRFATRVSQLSVAADLERRPGPRTSWKSGLLVNRMEYESVGEGGVPQAFPPGRGDGKGIAAYSQIHWKPNSRWLVEGGLRLDHWRPSDAVVSTAGSPRIAVKRFFGGGRWAVRGAAGRYTQFLHSVRDEQIPFGLDAWILTGSKAPPLVSDQLQLGVEGWLGDGDTWYASTEVYRRSFDGLVARNWAEDPANPNDDLVAGDGWSYGADFLVRKDRGVTTGWVSVSLLKAVRRLPDTDAGMVPALMKEHPAPFDRRLDVDLVVRHELPGGVTGGLRWNLGSGLPYTLPLADYWINRRQLIDLKTEPFAGSTLHLGPRNGERYPLSHRLDLSFRRTWEKSWGRVTPYLNVMNIYNRRNIQYYSFTHSFEGTRRTEGFLMPILPTIGVEVSF